jgi:hydroxyacylglutathione hydrolase
MVVDPGDEPDRVLEVIKKRDLKVEYIVCTHAHFDHIAGVSEVKAATKGKVVLHSEDLAIYRSSKEHAALWGFDTEDQPEPDIFVVDGDKIKIGGLEFGVMHTPGHSPGGICLFANGIVVTGDVLFAGSVGRTDLPGGSINKLKESFRRLMTLSDDVRVLPGHGPESTIGREKEDNFFGDAIL